MRNSDWIQVHYAGRFYPFDPSPEEIDIRDIALAASRIPRWGGFTDPDQEALSVAQHKVLVSLYCNPCDALAGLLHDSEEPFMGGDMPRPIKHDPRMAFYRQAGKDLRRVILVCYGLSPDLPRSVLEADEVLLATEARDLLPRIDPEFKAKIANIPTLPERIVPLPARAARDIFLARFETLTQ